MKFVALISGGKDSLYNVVECVKHGHELVALANIYPEDDNSEDIDSFMYQTIGHNLIQHYDKLLQVELFREKTCGKAKNELLTYEETSEDEVEDMFKLLSRVLKAHPDVMGVSCGAIASNYQRNRVINVCKRLSLKPLFMLWGREQNELMIEMINYFTDAIIIKVSSLGLDERHLGLNIQDVFSHLKAMNKKYGINVCGEGGEYETIVLDAPIFKKYRLSIVNLKIEQKTKCEAFSLKLDVRLDEKI